MSQELIERMRMEAQIHAQEARTANATIAEIYQLCSGGEPVTGFSLAVDSGYGDKKQTLWLDCSAWGKRWEGVTPYLVKGAQVSVQGELGTREHEGKTYITVDVKEVKLGGKGEAKPESSASRQQRQAPTREPSYADEDGDGIPFRQFRHRAYF
jgi:single-strand DNA-binding protein